MKYASIFRFDNIFTEVDWNQVKSVGFISLNEKIFKLLLFIYILTIFIVTWHYVKNKLFSRS